MSGHEVGLLSWERSGDICLHELGQFLLMIVDKLHVSVVELPFDEFLQFEAPMSIRISKERRR